MTAYYYRDNIGHCALHNNVGNRRDRSIDHYNNIDIQHLT